MQHILDFAQKNHVPIIRDESLGVLIENVKKIKPKRILEIGTAIGYSGIHMLKISEATLTTIEIDSSRYEIARSNFERFGLSERVKMHNIDALEYLKQAVKANETFDFVFLDGPKGQYIKYLQYIEKLLNDGGVIFADNVYFRGMVKGDKLPPHKYRTIVVNMRKYLQAVNNAPFNTEIIDIEDGIAITRKEEK